MGKTIRVEVTEEDIAKGEKKDHCYCPLALAFKRAGLKDPIVENYTAEHAGGLIELPLEACDFVHDFDLGRPVEPFTFTVELP